MANKTPIHREGFVETELHRIASTYPQPVDQKFVNVVFAEALLMLLERTKRRARSTRGGASK